MQFEHGKKARLPKLPRGSGFYLALTLAVIASGLGVWGTVNSSLRGNLYTVPETAGNSINWDNYVTRPMETEAQQANEPVTNVRDERSTAATTTAAATKPENAPYTGEFALPFGTLISKDYSNGEMVKSETMGDWRVHNGVDFEGEMDQDVLAMQSGSVKSVAADPLWGLVVTIDHGQGVVARYCGLSENSTPQEGQEVKKGESIGIIAQVPCESAEGIHLHLEVTVNGKAADPLAVMNKVGES